MVLFLLRRAFYAAHLYMPVGTYLYGRFVVRMHELADVVFYLTQRHLTELLD